MAQSCANVTRMYEVYWWLCTAAVTVEPVRRPPAPVNASARWLTGGEVLVSWQQPAAGAVYTALHGYTVEYRTVGRWVPLIRRVHNTSFVWKTASRGVTYQFRVRSRHDLRGSPSTSVHSLPSNTVSLLPDGRSVVSSLIRVRLHYPCLRGEFAVVKRVMWIEHQYSRRVFTGVISVTRKHGP